MLSEQKRTESLLNQLWICPYLFLRHSYCITFIIRSINTLGDDGIFIKLYVSQTYRFTAMRIL